MLSTAQLLVGSYFTLLPLLIVTLIFPGLFHQSCALSVFKSDLLADTSQVGLQPVLESAGRVFFVSPGEKVVLPCVVRNKGSLVRLWKQGPRLMFADEMRVRRDSRYSVSQAGELVIAGFSVSDRGQYRCELETHTDSPVFLRHRLEVAEAPAVRRLPVSGAVEVAERENTTLQCLVTGKPRPRVSWGGLGQAGGGSRPSSAVTGYRHLSSETD